MSGKRDVIAYAIMRNYSAEKVEQTYRRDIPQQ